MVALNSSRGGTRRHIGVWREEHAGRSVAERASCAFFFLSLEHEGATRRMRVVLRYAPSRRCLEVAAHALAHIAEKWYNIGSSRADAAKEI